MLRVSRTRAGLVRKVVFRPGTATPDPFVYLNELEEKVALGTVVRDVSQENPISRRQIQIRLFFVNSSPASAGGAEGYHLIARVRSEPIEGVGIELRLNDRPFGNILEAQRMAARALSQTRANKAVFCLRCSDEHISTDFITAVTDALKETKATGVDLAGNNFGKNPESGRLFAEALHLTKVRRLDLSSNAFSSHAESAGALLAALKDCQLSKLSVADNALGEHEQAGLAAIALLESPTLKRLDLSGNRLEKYSNVAFAVAGALGRSSIQSVKMSADMLNVPATCLSFGRALARTGATSVTIDHFPKLHPFSPRHPVMKLHPQNEQETSAMLNNSFVNADYLNEEHRVQAMLDGYLKERTKMKEDSILRATAAEIYEGVASEKDGLLPDRSGDFVNAFTEHAKRRGIFTDKEVGRMRGISPKIARIR